MSRPFIDDYDLIVFDLDGVLYLGSQPISGAPEAIRGLAEAGVAVAYVTNNASSGAAEVADRLVRLGMPAQPTQVLTSAYAAAQQLRADLPPGAPVLVVGSTALVEEVRGAGLTPVDTAEAAPVAVVQGYGPDIGWAQLAEACIALRSGVPWLVTNTDATLPSPRGPLPGNGSLVAALSTALGGRRPDTVAGKPRPTLFELAVRERKARKALVVGDRLETDVAGAVDAGLDSLLVLTGVSGGADVLLAGPHERPTFVAADLSELSKADHQVRVPQWRDGTSSGRWQVTHDGERLVLADLAPSPAAPVSRDDVVAAVRALAAGAWAHPEWSGIAAAQESAAQVLHQAGLERFGGWSPTAPAWS